LAALTLPSYSIKADSPFGETSPADTRQEAVIRSNYVFPLVQLTIRTHKGRITIALSLLRLIFRRSYSLSTSDAQFASSRRLLAHPRL
jgi:hypothetical protein